MQAKSGEVDAKNNKPKERIIGQIQVKNKCANVDW